MKKLFIIFLLLSALGLRAATNYQDTMQATTVYGTQISAGVLTNRGSAGGKIQYTDAGGKMIDASVGSGLSFSAGTLSASGGSVANGWSTNGNNSSPADILGTTNQMNFRMMAFSNEVAVFDTNNTIRMGRGNVIQTNAATDASVWGGYTNTILGSSLYSTIVGGQNNTIGAAGVAASGSVIVGGYQNTNYGLTSFIYGNGNWLGNMNSGFVGGHANLMGDISGGSGGFIGAGANNYIGTNTDSCAIVAGNGNNISNGLANCFIGSGFQNSIGPGSADATIPGGFQNAVNGFFSLAAGNRAKATHNGDFVWGDSTSADQTDFGADSFTIRATGGEYLTSGGTKTASYISNNVSVNGGTVYSFSSSTLLAGIYLGTNTPGNGRGTDLANGAIGSTNIIQVDVPTAAKVFAIDTNGNVGMSSLTASRIVLTDTKKNVTSAAASGAVPIDADGSATTFVQVNTLAPGNVVTQGNSFAMTFSNNVTVDATHKSIAAHISGVLGPAPSAVTNVACGPSSVLTLDANAHDSAFQVKIVTGSAPTTGLIFHLTYGTAYTTPPHIVWSHTSAAAGQLGGRPYTTNSTTTGFDFGAAGPVMTSSTNYEWTFITIE